MAVAVHSAFHSNFAACGLNLSFHSFDDAFSHFGTKSESYIHITDVTVRIAMHPMNTQRRR